MTNRPAILCVEDDDLHRELVSELARPAPVQFVTDLETATIAMETGKFDAVLLDLGLPSSSGLETCIRARTMWPDSPIVVHSGTDDEDLMQQCIAAGADDYLVKRDVTQETLMRSIAFAIERRRRMAAEVDNALAQEHKEALEQQLAMQTALVRTIGHELNTPLTPIRLRLSILSRHEDPKVVQAAEVIQRNMDRLQRSLANSLEAWKVEEAPHAPPLTQVPVAPVIEEILQDVQSIIDATGVDMQVQLDDVELRADEDRLHHLLANVITNAVRYSDSWVRIRAHMDGDRPTVEVSNDGHLPDPVKRHLFAPFVNRFRDDDATASGAGLGIHVAKTLANTQDLSLALVSNDPVSFRLRTRRGVTTPAPLVASPA